MLMCSGENKTHVLLRMTGSYGCYISAEAVTQAICLLLKPIKQNEHIILNVGAIRVSCILYATGWGQ
jgi:hypothetical protein